MGLLEGVKGQWCAVLTGEGFGHITEPIVSVLDSDATVFVLMSQMVHDLDAGMLVTVQIRRGTGRGHCREGVTATPSLR